MDYSFIRKLTRNVTSTDARQLYLVLQENGVEVFIQKGDNYYNLTEENVTVGNNSELNEWYVSAADVSFARSVVTENGLEHLLCSENEANRQVSKSEIEKAEEEFYRKHKQNQRFAWIIIIGVIIFMGIQFFIQ